MSKHYLGDSVYIRRNEAGCFILTTENGLPDDPSNVIYLEPDIVLTLLKILKEEGLYL